MTDLTHSARLDDLAPAPSPLALIALDGSIVDTNELWGHITSENPKLQGFLDQGLFQMLIQSLPSGKDVILMGIAEARSANYSVVNAVMLRRLRDCYQAELISEASPPEVAMIRKTHVHLARIERRRFPVSLFKWTMVADDKDPLAEPIIRLTDHAALSPYIGEPFKMQFTLNALNDLGTLTNEGDFIRYARRLQVGEKAAAFMLGLIDNQGFSRTFIVYGQPLKSRRTLALGIALDVSDWARTSKNIDLGAQVASQNTLLSALSSSLNDHSIMVNALCRILCGADAKLAPGTLEELLTLARNVSNIAGDLSDLEKNRVRPLVNSYVPDNHHGELAAPFLSHLTDLAKRSTRGISFRLTEDINTDAQPAVGLEFLLASVPMIVDHAYHAIRCRWQDNTRKNGKVSLALETETTGVAGGHVLRVTVSDNGDRHDLFEAADTSHDHSEEEGREARVWMNFKHVLQAKGGDLECSFHSRTGNTYVMTIPC